MKEYISDIFYIVMNAFRTFVIYKFMSLIFEEHKKREEIEFLSYSFYFIVITLVYLGINVPIVNLICNLLCLFMITFNYRAPIKTHILSVIYIYAMLLISEGIVVTITGYIKMDMFERGNYSSVLGYICIPILPYIITLILRNLRNIKKGITIPLTYWIAVIFVPIATIYLVLTLFYSSNLPMVQLLICVSLLLLANIFMFTLYDRQIEVFEEEKKRKELELQNKYYAKQLEVIQSSENITKSLRHDMNNHFLVMERFLETKDYSRLTEYIKGLQNVAHDVNQYVASGNIIIDSLVNFKIYEAKEKKITVEKDIYVPAKLHIDDSDLTVLLGNLMDNAITAALQVKDEKIIKLQIKYDKGRLILSISNTHNNTFNQNGDHYLTTKHHKDFHGYGLTNVKEVVEKYNGSMELEHTNHFFYTTILLYEG